VTSAALERCRASGQPLSIHVRDLVVVVIDTAAPPTALAAIVVTPATAIAIAVAIATAPATAAAITAAGWTS
jgi:hypothetical protein